MNFEGVFDKNKYQELVNYLDTLKDIKYKEFMKNIVGSDNVLGIKTDKLKSVAKEISKNDYLGFIDNNKSSVHELVLLEGLLYGYLKISFSEIKALLDKYILKLDNWAEVDSTVSNLKIFKKADKEGFNYAKKLVHNKKPFIKRFGIIILLNYYLHDKYIDKVLEIVSDLKSKDYYVKMAISWLMSTAYIKYKEKTLVYLVNISDDFIYNKTLSKIVESRKINDKERKFIKSLKRN